jgi:hypothetical protein
MHYSVTRVWRKEVVVSAGQKAFFVASHTSTRVENVSKPPKS